MTGQPEVALTIVDALLLTMADGQDAFRGWMSVDSEGKIAGIGPGEPPAREGTVLDAAGRIVAPGFVSAHSHLHTSGLRGLAAGQPLYPWLQANTQLLLGASAEDMYWSTLHGALDFISNGITSAFNFAHGRVVALYDPTGASSPAPQVRPPEFLLRQCDGAADSGIRVLTSLRVEDEVFGPTGALEDFDAMSRAVREQTATDQFLGLAVYGGVQWANTRRTAELEAETMERYEIINQAHFVETAEHLGAQQVKFDWYQAAGALGPSMLFGHFVHPTDAMVDAVAETGSGVVWQPTSNGRLGSGIADVVRYRERGIRIGVGLDDQSCTDISDPFQNLRIGMYTLRASHHDAGIVMPREALRMHTLGSAEVLGIADRVGSLEVGKYADFLLVDPCRPDTGPIWNAYATYVFACGLRNLIQVWIGGRCVSVDGRSQHPDVATVSAQLHERLIRIARDRGLPLPIGAGRSADETPETP